MDESHHEEHEGHEEWSLTAVKPSESRVKSCLLLFSLTTSTDSITRISSADPFVLFVPFVVKQFCASVRVSGPDHFSLVTHSKRQRAFSFVLLSQFFLFLAFFAPACAVRQTGLYERQKLFDFSREGRLTSSPTSGVYSRRFTPSLVLLAGM